MNRPDITFTITVNPIVYVYGCACDLNHRLADIGSIVWPPAKASPLKSGSPQRSPLLPEPSIGQEYWNGSIVWPRVHRGPRR